MFNRAMLGLVVSCALMLAPGAVFGQGGSKDLSADKPALMKASDELIQAEIKGDIDAMNRLFTPDYTHNHAGGIIENKAQYMKRFNPVQYAALDLSEEQVRFYGVTAVIVGHAQITSIHDGKVTPPTQNIFLEVWVHEDGNWRCAAWVTTRIPSGGAAPAPMKN